LKVRPAAWHALLVHMHTVAVYQTAPNAQLESFKIPLVRVVVPIVMQEDIQAAPIEQLVPIAPKVGGVVLALTLANWPQCLITHQVIHRA
jgi:hypothetical protein